MRGLKRRNPGQPEFYQAVHELMHDIFPFTHDHPSYAADAILERLTEPDRIIIFRVTWEDDQGKAHANRGWRVQFNNSIGPYKGGLRFHPSVNQSILKFLGFEQTFKNSLTGLPMGGAKGGSNFDPKGKSDREIMRFCQAFMSQLAHYIGEDTDVPAGDIGVGSREISYMFGQWKRLENRFAGVMTGKNLAFGGSLVRKEATGYGAVYFAEEMFTQIGGDIEGKTCVVSGSGNVALYCIEKLLHNQAKVVAASDSSGTVHDPDGITWEKFEFLQDLKENRRGRIREYAEKFGCQFVADANPWSIPCDIAFPCATQNELNGADAAQLVKNGVKAVVEGANMPCDPDAIAHFQENKILYAPGKASNAGGVSVSGLEQSQNSLRLSWSREEVDTRLRGIMHDIHKKCIAHGVEPDGSVNYVRGANIGGFIRVADAMLAQGLV
ncbi:MAG: NADP-specific glutamate dehydrogenase [Verrucomicrobiaceae bacterium]|nr:NADP-specific glutamate dehydrogenase [Verrucomicrobiaceae bacterium]